MDTHNKRVNMINYDCGDNIALDSPSGDLDQLKNLQWLIFFYDYTFIGGVISKVELTSKIVMSTELTSKVVMGTELTSKITMGIELTSKVDN